jgi:hypothetical protein
MTISGFSGCRVHSSLPAPVNATCPPERLSQYRGFYGGRDRDRTCDPYHVKVVRIYIKALVRKVFFGQPSWFAQPLPSYFSFFIARARWSALTVAYRSTMRSDFQPPSCRIVSKSIPAMTHWQAQ